MRDKGFPALFVIFWIGVFVSSSTTPPGFWVVHDYFWWDKVSQLAGMVISGSIVFFFAVLSFTPHRYIQRDPTVLMLKLIFGSSLIALVASQHVVSMLVSIEIISLSLYGLFGVGGFDRKGGEAAAKFVVINTVGSAVLALAFAFLYFDSGSMNFSRIFQIPSLLTSKIGLSFFAAGLLIKLGIAPFHLGFLDAIDGAKNWAAAVFMVTLSAAFMYLYIKISYLISGSIGDLLNVVCYFACFSMLISSLFMVVQISLKRILGLVLLNHTAFVILGSAVGGSNLMMGSGILIHVLSFSLGLGLILGIVMKLETDDVDHINIHDLQSIWFHSPVLSFFILIGMATIVGIPPLMSFATKTSVILSLLSKQNYLGLFVFIVSYGVSLYTFMRIFLTMTIPSDSSKKSILNVKSSRILNSLFFTIVLLIFLGGTLIQPSMKEFFVLRYDEKIAKDRQETIDKSEAL